LNPRPRIQRNPHSTVP
jgi:hypothetical protein